MVKCSELEAIALGAPTDDELEAWIQAGNEETLWEHAIRERRGIPDHDRWYPVHGYLSLVTFETGIPRHGYLEQARDTLKGHSGGHYVTLRK